jgi:DNA primase
MDADAGGRKITDMLLGAFKKAGNDLVFWQQEPKGAKDWNDVLRMRSKDRGYLSAKVV